MNAQDEEAPKETFPPGPVLDESQLRPAIQDKLCKLLIRRYLEPIDNWINDRKAGAVFPRGQENTLISCYIKDPIPEHWFVLVIQQGKSFDNCIWIKFYLSFTEFVEAQGPHGQTSSLDETEFWPYIQDKKEGLIWQLEQSFIEYMNDKDLAKTISNGEAHLYKLITRDTKVETLRKEDLIY